MTRRRATSTAGSIVRPHDAVVTNLIAMQARLRGDVVVPMSHPSIRRRAQGIPAWDARSPVPVPGPGPSGGAQIIRLPGLGNEPISNADREGSVRSTTRRLAEMQQRLARLEDAVRDLLARTEPDGAGSDAPASIEEAIARLQRVIDHRLGPA